MRQGGAKGANQAWSGADHRRSVAAMSAQVRTYFATLAERSDPATLAGVRKSCVFDIEGAGTWLVTVDNGIVEVHEGDGDAHSRVTTSAGVFERILRRELKPTSAYLTGRMQIQGELAAVMRLQPLLETRE
jgi:putative sterol carrier protein